MNWNEVYEFPLTTYDYTWVYDKNRNFVFEFYYDRLSDDQMERILNKLNGTGDLKLETEYNKKTQEIHLAGDKTKTIILIRGWGNLTGTGAKNLPGDVAEQIQDTFAEHLVEILKR